MGCDLFPFAWESPGKTLLVDCDDAIVALLYEALTEAIPQLRVRADRESAAARVFVNNLYAYALGLPCASDLDDALAALDADAPAFAQYLLHFSGDAFDILQTLVAAIVPIRARPDAQRRLHLAMRAVGMLIHPAGNLRRYLVG